MNYIMDYCEKTDKLLNVDRIMLIILLFFLVSFFAFLSFCCRHDSLF